MLCAGGSAERGRRGGLGRRDEASVVTTWPLPLPAMREVDIVRFWSKVRRGGPNDCWTWTAKTDRSYGAFKLRGRMVKAHRVAFFLASGGCEPRVVRHSCDNPPCCNPSHLLAGTNRDNVQDRYARARDRHAVHQQHGLAKLTWVQVEVIRARHKAGERGRVLAAEFGVSESTISLLVNGKSHMSREYVPRRLRG